MAAIDLPPLTNLTPAVTLTQPTLVVSDAPDALTRLALGARLEGVVLTEGGRGPVQVQTEFGTLTVSANIPLAKGASVLLVLRALGPRPAFQILAIDGAPPGSVRPSSAGILIQPTGGTPTGTPAAAAAAPSTPLTLALGSTLQATVLTPISNPAAQGTPPVPGAPQAIPESPQAVPGAPQGVRVPAAGVPQTAPPAPVAPSVTLQPAASSPLTSPQASSLASSLASSQASSLASSQASSLASSLTSSLASPRAASAPGLPTASGPPPPAGSANAAQHATPPSHPAGTQVSARIVALQLPGSVPAAPPTIGGPVLVEGAVLTGTVNGTTPSGQPLINTPAGVLALDTRVALPPGTTVTLEVTGKPLPPADATTPRISPFSREGLILNRGWPDLTEAVQVVSGINPATAQTLLNAGIAQPNNMLAASLLFILSALRGGDVSGWLGEGFSRTLQRFRPDLLSRLGEDFQRLGQLAERPVSGDWRMIIFPFMSGAEIEQIRLFMRQRGGKRRGAEKNADARFVIDVELSRLGHLQLDGLVGKENKRLDLIVRTAAPLPTPMRNDIRRIFEDAGAVTGMIGGLTFQSAPAHFVEVSPTRAPTGMEV